jgi:uncharacterized protein
MILTASREKGKQIELHNGNFWNMSAPVGPVLCQGNEFGDSQRVKVDVTTYRSYTLPVRFEWDERKRQSNLEKHRVDFADLEVVFAGETLTVLDDRFEYAEHRFITLGLLRGIILTIAHTETDEVIRIISARRATRYEQETYFKKIKQ